jgi:bifunctional DNA-binding transcriptional regulator/antitoxin component of YhaV-PrlF toxin-antitoxin module
MAKVTSKYQVTMPKKIADSYAIRPEDEIDWVVAGDVIRVIPPGRRAVALDWESQLRLFDQATERQRQRQATPPPAEPRGRGWSREDLYRRGRSH